MQLEGCNMQHATTARKLQHATYTMWQQRSGCNKQNGTRSMQHAARGHAAWATAGRRERDVQHATTQRERCNKTKRANKTKTNKTAGRKQNSNAALR
jgi:hypothetical protein